MACPVQAHTYCSELSTPAPRETTAIDSDRFTCGQGPFCCQARKKAKDVEQDETRFPDTDIKTDRLARTCWPLFRCAVLIPGVRWRYSSFLSSRPGCARAVVLLMPPLHSVCEVVPRPCHCRYILLSGIKPVQYGPEDKYLPGYSAGSPQPPSRVTHRLF